MNEKKAEYMVLGVAFGWGQRKGFDVFQKLAERLDERFRIVLVGTDDVLDQQLPDNVLTIHRTNNQRELAEIYSAADLLVNPTREDTYPTVNMEAIACGTPVVTFDTGGSPEIVDQLTGVVVPCDDIDGLVKEIERICIEKPFSREDCVHKASAFNKKNKYKEYINLYHSDD